MTNPSNAGTKNELTDDPVLARKPPGRLQATVNGGNDDEDNRQAQVLDMLEGLAITPADENVFVKPADA